MVRCKNIRLLTSASTVIQQLKELGTGENRVEIVQGQVYDYASLVSAMEGCRACVSAGYCEVGEFSNAAVLWRRESLATCIRGRQYVETPRFYQSFEHTPHRKFAVLLVVVS